jgi:tryptophan synthase beta chain
MNTAYSRHYGPYGGRYVPEMLVPALSRLESEFIACRRDADFRLEFRQLLREYAGRPTPLCLAANLTKALGGPRIYLKMEGLAHTGAHKINNVIGQAVLARRCGKTRLIAETGAGQHGVATAAVAAKLGMACTVFMGEVDMRRQYPNVFYMRRMGAEVVAVQDGTRTLKDAVNAALKHWIEHLDESHYLLGSALGPAPYPAMVREFQSVIGREVRARILRVEGRLPDMLVACVGGGSNSIGLFAPFIKDSTVQCLGIEAGGRGPDVGDNASRFGPQGQLGIAQGYASIFMQDEHGQLLPTHSVSAGLDYAGIGPQLAFLADSGRIRFESATDQEALSAYELLCRTEGIIPALESAHAVAGAIKTASTLSKEALMVINISGRGEKDLFITARELEKDSWTAFLSREVNDAQ